MKKVFLLFALLFAASTGLVIAQVKPAANNKAVWQPIVTDGSVDTQPNAVAVITFASNKSKIHKAIKKVDNAFAITLADSASLANEKKNIEYTDSLRLANTLLINNNILKTALYHKAAPKADTTYKPFHATTNRELQATLLEKIAVNMDLVKQQFATVAQDSMRAAIPQKMPATVTSLKQQIALVLKDSVRASLYQTIANAYLAYDSITIRRTKQLYQEEALDFTMKALHSYSKANSLNGLFLSYNNLSKIYTDQKKYPQAKWFILQANTIARQHNDQPHIVSTLISLAGIKMAIKDYKLAQGDLNEALTFAALNRSPKMEANIQESLAMLYAKMNDPKKSAIALKRHNAIEDSIAKAEQAKLLAVAKAQDSTALAKKKLLTSASKKSSKTNLTAKTVSL